MRLLAALLPSALALPELPEHLRRGELGKELRAGEEPAALQRSVLGFLPVPLDHFGGSSATWELRYFVNDAAFQEGGALLLSMPGEGPTTGCRDTELAHALAAVAVCAEHRFFGASVPRNSSTVTNLHYLTVQQNLADQVMLVRHIRTLYPSISHVVAEGGSYSGASAAWIRRAYPQVVDAAVAESPPVTARIAFSEYDTSNLVALASPDARCAQAMVRVTQALERQLASNRTALMLLFNAKYNLWSPQGDFDFMYALGDAVATPIQYGRKEHVCKALRPLYGRTARDTEYTEAFANFTLAEFGADYFSECWYNSTCIRDSAHAVPAQSARSWYWLKCTQLGYFQVAPERGASARPRGVTVRAALRQCAYVFPGAMLISDASVADFNARFGGGAIGGVSNVFELDYSDDPWKMASSASLVARNEWPLTARQPFLYLTCDGCAHCGSGVPRAQLQGVEEQKAAVLREWGVSPPAAAEGAKRGTDLLL